VAERAKKLADKLGIVVYSYATDVDSTMFAA